MTRAEQEAFEKWIASKGVNVEGFIEAWGSDKYLLFKSVFLAGYRAGFEAQHYELTPSDGSHPMGFKGIHYEVDDGNRTD